MPVQQAVGEGPLCLACGKGWQGQRDRRAIVDASGGDRLAGQNRHWFGVRTESLDQLNLIFEEDEAIAETAEEQIAPSLASCEDKTPRQYSCKPLPDHLDRHDEVLFPGEDCTRCGGNPVTR